jgi:hypothetical protein
MENELLDSKAIKKDGQGACVPRSKRCNGVKGKRQRLGKPNIRAHRMIPFAPKLNFERQINPSKSAPDSQRWRSEAPDTYYLNTAQEI